MSVTAALAAPAPTFSSTDLGWSPNPVDNPAVYGPTINLTNEGSIDWLVDGMGLGSADSTTVFHKNPAMVPGGATVLTQTLTGGPFADYTGVLPFCPAIWTDGPVGYPSSATPPLGHRFRNNSGNPASVIWTVPVDPTGKPRTLKLWVRRNWGGSTTTLTAKVGADAPVTFAAAATAGAGSNIAEFVITYLSPNPADVMTVTWADTTGGDQLQISAAALSPAPNPSVLTVTPAQGAVVASGMVQVVATTDKAITGMGALKFNGVTVPATLAGSNGSKTWTYTVLANKLNVAGTVQASIDLTTATETVSGTNFHFASSPYTWSFTYTPPTPSGGKIVLVSNTDTADDHSAYVSFLNNTVYPTSVYPNGVQIEDIRGKYYDLTPALQTELNAANVVVILPYQTMSTGRLDHPADSKCLVPFTDSNYNIDLPTIARWNGVTAPIINHKTDAANGYNWGWGAGGKGAERISSTPIYVSYPGATSDPLMQGVTIVTSPLHSWDVEPIPYWNSVVTLSTIGDDGTINSAGGTNMGGLPLIQADGCPVIHWVPGKFLGSHGSSKIAAATQTAMGLDTGVPADRVYMSLGDSIAGNNYGATNVADFFSPTGGAVNGAQLVLKNAFLNVFTPSTVPVGGPVVVPASCTPAAGSGLGGTLPKVIVHFSKAVQGVKAGDVSVQPNDPSFPTPWVGTSVIALSGDPVLGPSTDWQFDGPWTAPSASASISQGTAINVNFNGMDSATLSHVTDPVSHAGVAAAQWSFTYTAPTTPVIVSTVPANTTLLAPPTQVVVNSNVAITGLGALKIDGGTIPATLAGTNGGKTWTYTFAANRLNLTGTVQASVDVSTATAAGVHFAASPYTWSFTYDPSKWQGKIVLVSNTDPSDDHSAYVSFLTNTVYATTVYPNGVQIEDIRGKYYNLTTALRDDLNANAKVVVVLPFNNTSSLAPSGTVIDLWNGLTVPIIQHKRDVAGPYIWGWGKSGHGSGTDDSATGVYGVNSGTLDPLLQNTNVNQTNHTIQYWNGPASLASIPDTDDIRNAGGAGKGGLELIPDWLTPLAHWTKGQSLATYNVGTGVPADRLFLSMGPALASDNYGVSDVANFFSPTGASVTGAQMVLKNAFISMFDPSKDPRIASVVVPPNCTPAPGVAIGTLPKVVVHFTLPVQGVKAADLTVNPSSPLFPTPWVATSVQALNGDPVLGPSTDWVFDGVWTNPAVARTVPLDTLINVKISGLDTPSVSHITDPVYHLGVAPAQWSFTLTWLPVPADVSQKVWTLYE